MRLACIYTPFLLFSVVVAGQSPSRADAIDIVKNRRPVATIVITSKLPEEAKSYAPEAEKPGRKPTPKKGKMTDAEAIGGPDAEAATLLADWIRKMTEASVSISETPEKGKTAIYVGYAAIQAGLKVDDVESASQEGIRIVADKEKILIAGQRASVTPRAVCRFLEEFGCRVFMDGEIGEVYPSLESLAAGSINITEKPVMLYRNPKGPSWQAKQWRMWNGAGGTSMNHSHSWGGYVTKEDFEKHPEYFAMRRDGERAFSGWYCTSNPGLRDLIAERATQKIREGNTHPSLSPSDGNNYCQCEKCLAQDDPNALEPSSKTIAMSNRYVDFFDAVGRKVAKQEPKSILSFYCYADYTQPPTKSNKISPNLCAVIAPIRYCRLHGIGEANCPQRVQQKEMIEGWASVANKLGYYMYMYDLAEVTVPVCMVERLKRDMPYLHRKGCISMTQEVLSHWHLYGPHIHLGLKLMVNPLADADAIMEDYYEKFFGPAGPHMKEYWTSIDNAVSQQNCHSGCFFWIQSVYTPEFLEKLRVILEKAAFTAKENARYAERVAIHTEGYKSAAEYMQLRDAMIRGDFAKAQSIYVAFQERLDRIAKKGWANPEYASAYMKRFNGSTIDMGARLTSGNNKLLQVLPDEWRMMYDTDGTGLEKKYHEPGFDDSQWPVVSTFVKTLSAQGLPDRTEVLWYRTTFEAPPSDKQLSLFVGEVDGLAEVWVNGRQVESASTPVIEKKPPGKKKGAEAVAGAVPLTPAGLAPFKRRQPFEVDITAAAKPGKNSVVIKADHTRITELNLGGIIRPVYLIEKGRE